jgi:hypothetical protein
MLPPSVEVVEGATLATFVTGATVMIIVGILLNIAGLGMLCWAMFRLAVYALPFFVGVTAGLYALQTGAGPSAPTLLVSSQARSHWLLGSMLLPLRARPSSALSLACCSWFRRPSPAIT